MKKIVLSLFLLGSVSSTAIANVCDYSSIEGIEYKVKDRYAKYVKNDFKAFPDKEWISQGALEDYLPLIKNPFKVTDTLAVTRASESYRTFLSDFRFKDIVVDGHAYYTDAYFNVEVTTSNCEKFYFDASGIDLDSFKYKFDRNDNKPITVKNYFDFLGGVLEPSEIEAKSKYDEFEGKTIVKTDYFDNYLIRGYYDSSKKKYDFIQVYIDLTSFTKSPNSTEERTFNFIRLAKDTDTKSHNVIQISHDVECTPNSILGCSLKEAIAVDVDENFLRKHKNGFRLKLIGNYSVEEEIIGDVVKAFLDETDQLRRSK